MKTNELRCILNCNPKHCNGECDTWNEIKSAIILLRKELDVTFPIDLLLESLDADKHLIKYAQNLCSRGFSTMIRDGRRDSVSGMDFIDVLSGDEFEQLISELYTNMRYSVRKTARTRDGGIDLVLAKDNKYILIQCKRYTPKKKVSVGVVRELCGVINASSTMAKGAIISSTGFTEPAEKFALKSGMQLINRNGLERMLNQYLPGELPGFRIEHGIQSLTKEKIKVFFTLSNISSVPTLC